MTDEIPTSLYRHFAGDGSLLYVGISLSWPARTRSHSRHSAWFGQVAKVEIEQFPSREAALIAERDAIMRERPKFNVIHNKGGDGQAASGSIRRAKRAKPEPWGGMFGPLRQIKGPHAIVGPALVYHGDTISMLVAHGSFGTEGELTEIILGEHFPELPQWTAAVASVVTLRRPDELTIEEARERRREIVEILTANLEVVQSFGTDLALATAYATQFPSNKSREVLDQVASERRQ